MAHWIHSSHDSIILPKSEKWQEPGFWKIHIGIWFDKVKQNKSYFYKCISYLDIISGHGLSHGESSTVHWSIGFKIQDPEYSDLSDFLRLFLHWIFSSCSHFVFDKRLLPKAPYNNMVFALVAFDKLVSDKLFKQN